MKKIPVHQLTLIDFIHGLMNELDLSHFSADERLALYQQFDNEIAHLIRQVIQLHVTDVDWSEIEQRFPGITDEEFIARLIENIPSVQLVVTEALQQFYYRKLELFNHLNNDQ